MQGNYASVGDRHTVLILAPYPYSLFISPMREGLEACGAEVRIAGPEWQSHYWEAEVYERYAPRHQHTFLAEADAHIDDIMNHWATRPTSIIYFEPPTAFLPHGIERVDIPTTIVLTEDRIHADLHPHLLPMFDRILTAFNPTVEMYRNRGVDRIFNWYLAPIPCFIYDKKQVRTIDVGFWGNLHPQVQRRRNKVIEEILDLGFEGYKIVVGDRAYFDDYNDCLNRAKIIIHDGQSRQLNMRVLEGMAAGCFVVAARPKSCRDYGPRQFIEGQHLVYFDNASHAKELIRHFLNNAEARHIIAAKGQRRALEVFKPENLARELIVNHLEQIPRDYMDQRLSRLEAWGQSIRGARTRYFVQSSHPAIALRNANNSSSHQIQNDLAVGEAILQRFSDATQRLNAILIEHPNMAIARANLVAVTHTTLAQDSWKQHASWVEKQIELLGRADPNDLDTGDLEAAYFPHDYTRFRIEIAESFYGSAGKTRTTKLLELQLYRTHLYCASAYMNIRNFDSALKHYNAALTLIPDDGYTMKMLAAAMANTHDMVGALTLLQTAVEAEPFFGDAQLRLVTILTAARRMTDTASVLRKIASNPLIPPESRESAFTALGKIIPSAIHAPATVAQ